MTRKAASSEKCAELFKRAQRRWEGTKRAIERCLVNGASNIEEDCH